MRALLLLAALFISGFASSALAEESSSSATSRKELRESIKMKREALKNDVAKEKAEFKIRAEQIRDTRKRMLVKKIETRLETINTHRVEKMTQAMDKLEDLLTKLSERSADLKLDGKNTTAFDLAIAEARTAMSAATAAIEAQSAKTYTPTIAEESTLKNTVGAAMSSLQQDLQSVRKTVIAAKQSVQKAAAEFEKIRASAEN